MSVTISLGQLANHVRVSTTPGIPDVPMYYQHILGLDLAAATKLIESRAPNAPKEAQNKAAVQIIGYWLQAPEAAAQRFGYNAWQNSGAAQILAPFIDHRAEAV